jgi:hypothetical protein
MDGPAMRPTTPLAVENSVGKPAANAAPNVGMGKRESSTAATLKANKAAIVYSQREGHHAIITGEDLMKMIRVRQRLSFRGLSDLKGS